MQGRGVRYSPLPLQPECAVLAARSPAVIESFQPASRLAARYSPRSSTRTAATASSHASGSGGAGHTLRVEVRVPLGISNGIPSRESKPVGANHCPNICPNVHVALDRLVGAPEADGPRARLTGEEAIWHIAPLPG